MNKKIIIGIVAIVLIIIAIILIILFAPKENKKKIEDKIAIKDVYNLDDKIVEEIEITLNEKTNVMKLTYTFDETSNKNMTGEFDGTVLYEKYFVDKSLFNKDEVKRDFNESNFQIIKGKDNKSYLLVYSCEEYYPSIYVYNDELELVSRNGINDDYYTWGGKNINESYDFFKTTNHYINIVTKAEDLTMYCNAYGECHDIVKVEDNKIYYLALKFNGLYNTLAEYKEASDYGIVEERVYEISDNELSYKVNNVYQVTEMNYLP